jgi:AcrR family transcriptional regulator
LSLYQNLFQDEKRLSLDRKARDFIRRRTDFLISLDQIIGVKKLQDFSKINLDEISAQAGLTKPTFYRYFNSKDDFLVGFGAFAYKKITETISKQIDVQSMQENSSELLVMVLTYYDIMKKHPGYIKILNNLGQQNTYLKIQVKSKSNPSEITQSEQDYINEWTRFRKLLEILPILTRTDSFFQKFPKFSTADIAEIFTLIFNGIITEFDQRNRILHERGIKNQEILTFIVKLLEIGMQKM